MSPQNICAQWGSRSKSSGLNGGCHLALKEKDQCGTALRLQPTQADVLATVLSRALYDEPQLGYMIPDQQERLRLLPAIFRNAIRVSQLNGEIYTTQALDGGALWIGPGDGLSLGGTMRTAFPSMRIQWRWANLKRCMTLGVHLDEVHRRLIRGLHWYLLALGVNASTQKERVCGTLLEPLLSRADSDGLPCYLEAFSENSLRIYKRHGFRIAGGGKIPRGGPDFWAMIRIPMRP